MHGSSTPNGMAQRRGPGSPACGAMGAAQNKSLEESGPFTPDAAAQFLRVERAEVEPGRVRNVVGRVREPGPDHRRLTVTMLGPRRARLRTGLSLSLRAAERDHPSGFCWAGISGACQLGQIRPSVVVSHLRQRFRTGVEPHALYRLDRIEEVGHRQHRLVQPFQVHGVWGVR
jgi:hypothetical protein